MASSPPPSAPNPKKAKVSYPEEEEEEEEEEEGKNHQSPKSLLVVRPPLPVPSDVTKPRYKRRKLAIFFGYCGHGYQGMQKNPGAKTIESDLEDALYLSFAVPESERGLPRRYDWARSARTDKGVSAAGQVVSGRFYADPPGLVHRLNSHLPTHQIRIFGYKRVTASFNAKKFCDRRKYVYLFPLFALDPEAHPDRESVMASLGSGNELTKCLECSERGRKVPGLMGRCPASSKARIGQGGDEEDDKGRPQPGESRGFVGSSDLWKDVEKEEDDDVGNSGFKRSELGGGERSPLGAEEEDDHNVGKDYNVGKVVINGVGKKGTLEVVKLTERSEVGNVCSASQDGATCSSVSLQSEVAVESSIVVPEEKHDNSRGDAAKTSKSQPEEGTPSGLVPRRRKFQYGEKEKERFNGILKRYAGTHNFHNFTTRTKAEDPSARRYIVSFNANGVVNIDGIDFVKCEVVGQSFMLHQIRKMIGLAVAIMRNCTPESIMDTAFRPDVRINVPTAPEVGLYLEECLFTSYNQKWKDTHEELSMSSYAKEAEEFKMTYIYSHIAAMEQREGSVALWLHSLNHRNYPEFRLHEGSGSNGAAAPVEEPSQVESMVDDQNFCISECE